MSNFNAEERNIMLQTARNTIEYCVTQDLDSLKVDLNSYSDKLRQTGACFVTLHLYDRLRGCIGSLQAHQPLILDIIQNSYSAAFRDPRFKPVTESEVPKLTLDISVLSAPQPINFSSEADLLSQIRPGIDGLILSDAGRHGTFLPSVWEQLPTTIEFWQHLKMKAGLPTDYWSNTLTVSRYTTELIS